MTPQSSVKFPKTHLKRAQNSGKHYKKRILRAVFALPLKESLLLIGELVSEPMAVLFALPSVVISSDGSALRYECTCASTINIASAPRTIRDFRYNGSGSGSGSGSAASHVSLSGLRPLGSSPRSTGGSQERCTVLMMQQSKAGQPQESRQQREHALPIDP